MPALENPKHEEFALLLARGVKQGEAYLKAGYSENKGAASRLAASTRVQDRVEELRTEIARKVQTAMAVVNEENWQSLADMGLTIEWVALQYKEIYEGSMTAGSFSSANTAVQNIQKLVEMERNGNKQEPEKGKNQINIGDMLSILDKLGDIVKGANTPNDEMVILRDITPEEPE